MLRRWSASSWTIDRATSAGDAGHGLEVGEIGQESRRNLRDGLPAKIRLDQ